MPYNTKTISPAHESKYNLKQKNQVILLMITDGEKDHYLAIKCLSALFRGITSKHHGDSICINCFHSFRTKNKLKKYTRVCKNHDYCYVEMPEEDNRILKYNRDEKSLRAPFVIYADLESLLEKIKTLAIIILKNHQQPK